MTACPNSDQYNAVSCTTRPVTHTAEVAVNSASAKLALPGPRLAKGSVRSAAPSKITVANPAMMICAEEKWTRSKGFVITIPTSLEQESTV